MTGGHGVCFDFSTSKPLAKLTATMFESGKVVSAVCHGPTRLLEVKSSSGEYLIAGKNVTGFSWNEEVNLEEELQKLGAKYGKAWMAFSSHVVEDGLLIKSQNPASAAGVGEAVVKKLRQAK